MIAQMEIDVLRELVTLREKQLAEAEADNAQLKSRRWVQCTSVSNECLGGCASMREHDRYRHAQLRAHVSSQQVATALDHEAMRNLAAQNELLRSAHTRLVSHLLQIRGHWRDFGQEHGLDELIECSAESALKQAQGEQDKRHVAGAACPACEVVVIEPAVFQVDEDGLCVSCGCEPVPVDASGRVYFEPRESSLPPGSATGGGKAGPIRQGTPEQTTQEAPMQPAGESPASQPGPIPGVTQSDDAFSEEFLRHAVANATQYDSTCRAMAAEILGLRRQRDEALLHNAMLQDRMKVILEAGPSTATAAHVFDRGIRLEAERDKLRAELAEAKALLRDISENYDCDSDAHRHNTRCRSCAAGLFLAAKSVVEVKP